MKKAGIFALLILFLWAVNGPAQKLGIIELISRLDLSEKQTKKVEEVRLKAEGKAIKLRAELKLARLDLRELLQKDYPNKEAIYKKVEEIGALKTRLEKDRIDARLETHKLLTLEQRRELRNLQRQLIRERKHPRQERRQPQSPRPPFLPPPSPNRQKGNKDLERR